MELVNSAIRGNLQTKIMLLLREEPMCGVELMRRLNISSPGTIYPALHSLEEKGLIFHEGIRTGAARKKVYRLTQKGAEELNQLLSTWTRLTCCDWSAYIRRFIDVIDRYASIEKGEKILCTLDAELTKEWLKEAEVTYRFDLENLEPESYDKIISLIGVGTVMEREKTDAIYYLSRLKRALKRGGTLIALEIERTDNLWAERYFVEIMGFREHPGMTADEFREVLEKVGFRDVVVHSAGGLLVSVSAR